MHRAELLRAVLCAGFDRFSSTAGASPLGADSLDMIDVPVAETSLAARFEATVEGS